MAMKLEVGKKLTSKQIGTIVGDESLSKSARVKELFLGGLDVKEISTLMGIRYNFAYNVVSNMVNMKGLEVVKERKGSVKAEIIDLLQAGKTKTEVSKALGVNYNYVFKIEKDLKGVQAPASKEA